MKKYLCPLYMLLLFSMCVHLYAIQWPVHPADINQIYEQYQNGYNYDIFTLHFEYSGQVLAVADATVTVVQSEEYVRAVVSKESMKDAENTHMVTLVIDGGFHVSYYGIVSSLKIGDTVQKRASIGKGRGHWYMRVFDTVQRKWVDPLAMLPDIDRSIAISIEEFAFYYQDGVDTPVFVNTNQIMIGSADLHLVLHIADRNSKKYILPYYIQVSIGDTQIVLTQRDILAMIDAPYLNTSGKMSLLLQNILIAPGYQAMTVTVRTPLSGYRKFRFGLVAASTRKSTP